LDIASEAKLLVPSMTVNVQPFRAVGSATFFFYTLFIVDFFLHLSQRVPGIDVIRPTLLLVVVIAALLYSQRITLSQRGSNSISDAMKVLIFYMILTIPFVTFPGSVIKENLSDFAKAVVFFYFTAMTVDTPSRLKKFLLVFVSCQLFRVLEPLYLNITSGYWGGATYIGSGDFANRLAGAPNDVINPNELGFVIVTLFPFLHYLLLPRGWISKILYVILTAALFYALILTMSRGALLALMVVAFMVFKESKQKLPLMIFAVVVVVSAWTVMNDTQKDRYLSLISSEANASATVDGRFRGMVEEFELGMRRPVFGHGLGTTPEAKYNFTGYRQASHNLYAELIIEIGLIGMYLFLRVLYRIYKSITKLRAIVQEGHIESQRILKVVLCVFFMYVIYSTNYWGLNQSYWYLLAGLTVALLQIIGNNPSFDIYGQENMTDHPLAGRR